MDWRKLLGNVNTETEKEQVSRESISQSGKIAELVLSDGRFCAVYPSRLWHLSAAADPDPYKQFAKMVCLSVLIDDEVVNAQEVFQMTIRDVNLIANHMQTS